MAADNLMNKVNEILSDPDAMGKISQMLGSAQGSAPSAPDANITEKITQIASKINEPDPKINLLSALRPYMNPARTQHIDRAIKMIQMTKITGFFKDI